MRELHWSLKLKNMQCYEYWLYQGFATKYYPSEIPRDLHWLSPPDAIKKERQIIMDSDQL